jgi:hypothetical protein
MATPLSASDQAWNDYMSSVGTYGKPIGSAPGTVPISTNPLSGQNNYKRTQPSKSTVSITNNPYLPMAPGKLPPIEFYLGPVPTLPEVKLPDLKLSELSLPGLTMPAAPTLGNLNLPNAPTLQGVDYSSALNQFRNIFNTVNTGVNPQFGVDVNKVAQDAISVASSLNLSPEQIKAMVSDINPSTGEIVSDTEEALKTLNDPAKITRTASAIAAGLNRKYQDEFESAMPGYKANMAQANALASNYLSGKIPQDVVDSVVRSAAAKGLATGLYGGGIGRNMVAKDLGLTSLQLQTTGANLLQQTANIATAVAQATMPVTGEGIAQRLMTDPNQVFSSMASLKRVDPTSIFNAVYVPTRQVFDSMLSAAQQSTQSRAAFEASKMIAPSSVFNTLITQAQYNQQISTQNALNNWETMSTMATTNNQIAEKNALNSWQVAQNEALNNWQSKQNQAMNNWQMANTLATTNWQSQAEQAYYNAQIKGQNAINAWQGQPLPGQFDVQRGQYVSYTPGKYQSTFPLSPGELSQNSQYASASSGADAAYIRGLKAMYGG